MSEHNKPFVINPAGEAPKDTDKVLQDAHQAGNTLWENAYCEPGGRTASCDPLPATLTRESLMRDGYAVSLPILALTTIGDHQDSIGAADGKPGISRGDLQTMFDRADPNSPVRDFAKFALDNFDAIRAAHTSQGSRVDGGEDSPDITADDLKATSAKYLDLLKQTPLLVEADFVKQHWDAFSTVMPNGITAAGLQALNDASPYQPALKALQDWAGPNRTITMADLDSIINPGAQGYAAFGVSVDELRRTFTPKI
ncbi:MAG: hypothetical protein U0105_09650 [Candidatus Obscuribacterales bacterium]